MFEFMIKPVFTSMFSLNIKKHKISKITCIIVQAVNVVTMMGTCWELLKACWEQVQRMNREGGTNWIHNGSNLFCHRWLCVFGLILVGYK